MKCVHGSHPGRRAAARFPPESPQAPQVPLHLASSSPDSQTRFVLSTAGALFLSVLAYVPPPVANLWGRALPLLPALRSPCLPGPLPALAARGPRPLAPVAKLPTRFPFPVTRPPPSPCDAEVVISGAAGAVPSRSHHLGERRGFPSPLLSL